MTPEEKKALRAAQMSANQKRLRAQKKKERILHMGEIIHPKAPHGTISGYNYWQCRCRYCQHAKKVERFQQDRKK